MRLPSDLPRGVLVHTKFWLAADEIIEAATELEASSGLHDWIFQGERKEAKPVCTIHNANFVLASRLESVSKEQLATKLRWMAPFGTGAS